MHKVLPQELTFVKKIKAIFRDARNKPTNTRKRNNLGALRALEVDARRIQEW